MRSSQNVATEKLLFRSRVMALSNNRLLFAPMGKGICNWQTVVLNRQQRYWGSIDATP